MTPSGSFEETLQSAITSGLESVLGDTARILSVYIDPNIGAKNPDSYVRALGKCLRADDKVNALVLVICQELYQHLGIQFQETVGWKLSDYVNDAIAKARATIGDEGSSEVFVRAAEDYKLVAKRIPSLASVFVELASYMDSWSLIEKAGLDHKRERYMTAAEYYKKAASILQTNRAWRYLANHYMACASMERGEALSRDEKQDQSVESFSSAAQGFRTAKQELENRRGQVQEPREKAELERWLQVTDEREKYCLGRVAIEDAKLLDKRGEEEQSRAKYHYASEVFHGLQVGTPEGQGEVELETLALLCEAWAKMKEAEMKASPEIYAEAASAFTRVEKVTRRKKLRLQAMANACICNALEFGTRFRRNRDTQLYAEIKKQLESATDYYQEAGIQNAANWTRATGNLFDALMYLADAATERDSKKKTELYQTSERYLQLAAKLYDQAGYAVKRDEARKHLQRAQEEKELLLSPVEALAEDPASTRVMVAPVSLVKDRALGLETFEAANVVGNLILERTELSVGSELTVELEMANVGKTPAMLIKLENVAPYGFEMERRGGALATEDDHIDLRGKRLEFLKTHQVRVPLRAIRKGDFELHPRILFVDEKGNYRSYEFEPALLTVRELGISGWLKGPK